MHVQPCSYHLESMAVLRGRATQQMLLLFNLPAALKTHGSFWDSLRWLPWHSTGGVGHASHGP